MYDFYPTTNDYTGTATPERFQIRASAAECAKWGIALDEEDQRNMNATMAADRVADQQAVTPVAKTMVHASQVSLDLRG